MIKKIFYMLLVAISYAVVAKAGFLATSFTSHISPIFPAAGISLATVMILGRPALFGVLIGSIVVNSTFLFDGTVLSLHAVLGKLLGCSIIGIGAMSGAAVGALLVRRFCNGQYPLSSGRNVLVLITVGALGCCMISPTVGVLTLSLKGIMPWSLFGTSWLTWWTGDAVGVILAAPLILAWNHSRPPHQISTGVWWLAFEASLLGGLSLLFCFFVFFKNVPIQFGLLPLLFWATARYGDRGATTVASAITILATIATSHGYGPFVMGSVNESLLLLQFFIGVIITSSLYVGGVLDERKRAEEALRDSERKTRAILDQSFVFIGLMSTEGILLDTNRAALKLVGASPLGVLNKPFWESPWWNHSTELQNKLRESIKSAAAGEEIHFEASHPTIDGSLRYVDFSLRPVKNEQGDILYLIPEGHDITERKRAEENLKKSQRKLSTLIGNLPGLAYSCTNDPDWTMIYMSTGCFNLTGFYPDELVGNQLNTYGNLIHQDDAKMVWQKVQDAINNNTFWQIEYRIHTKEGMEKWVWEQGCGVYSNTGELEVLEGFITDITERKRAEEALSRSESKYRDIVENAPMGIFRRELGGKFQYVNPGLIRQLECKTERELLDNYGLISQRWVSPERNDEFKALLLKNRSVYGYETETRLVDGTTKWFALYSFLDDSDQFINGFSLDITERKRTEERILRLAAAVDQISLDVVITDPDANILYTNPAVTQTMGYSAEELLGKNPRIFKSGRHDQAFYKQLWDTLKGGQSWVGRLENRAKDGHIVLQDASISPIRDDKGGIAGFVANRRDITKEVEMEARLAQAQKMEAIGTLAGGIAHDFNNILTPIVGYTALAQMKANDDPKLSEYLNQIGMAASRAADLARQILTFSRKAEQKKVPLQVSSVVKEALKLLRSSIPTSIEIRQEIATQALVLADPTQIHQIMMNLCTNSYQSMEKTGGVLAVSLKEMEIPHEKNLGREIRPGRYVVLEVSDTGCGMDKVTQTKIFDPYFTTKETGKGTGLGLAVVHGIVKDHQGMINVSSEPGRGTTFRVYLPMSENQMYVAHAKQEEVTPTEKHEHILFVDDEERICSMANEYLTEYGYVVDFCSNGRDALFAIEQDPQAYDLLITDMTMPGISGMALASKVLAIRSDFPVILCTGYSNLSDREDAASIGISAYMEKPVVMNDLLGKIKEVLKKENLRGQPCAFDKIRGTTD